MNDIQAPPNDKNAEMAVLGAIMMEESAIIKAMEIITADDFYWKKNQEIFKAFVSLSNAGTPIDLLTVLDELSKRGLDKKVGGKEYFAELITDTPFFKRIEHYCKIIAEKATLRRLISASNNIIKSASDNPGDINTLLAEAEKQILNISDNRNTNDFSSIAEAVKQEVKHIQELSKNGSDIIGVPTGFRDLDRILSGLQKSKLIYLAARPAMGKTALALNIAKNAASLSLANVAIFSLEMSKEELSQRMLCEESCIDSNYLRSGKLNQDEWERLETAEQNLSCLTIDIDDTPANTLSGIRSKCRRLASEKGLDLIIIDYLQLMVPEGKSENRQNEVSVISRGLKQIAREMNCPLICLSQLSREPEKRNQHKPILSDIRESGSLEQDADIVMMLYRESYYNEFSEKENVAELFIAKHRSGPTGNVTLKWYPEFMQFRNNEAFSFDMNQEKAQNIPKYAQMTLEEREEYYLD